MRICFVCNEYPPSPHGGIGSMVQTIARALVRAGHDVRIVGLYPDVRDTTWDTDAGVRVCRLRQGGDRLRSIGARYRLLRQVADWVRAGQVDLIEVPDWQGLAAYWPALSVPVVARLNGSAVYFDAEMRRSTHWLTRRLEAASLRRADAWCSVSRYTADRTKAVFGLSSDATAILPNPVALAPSTEWARRREGRVVFSGTLTEKKGVISLIDAWNRLAPRFAKATLHFFGKDGTAPGGGAMTAFLRSRLDNTASARVTFHGRVPRETVLDEMAAARVAVFPSFAEAFAIAPLEAMAAGCPTIGSSLGSGPELLDDGQDGLTVNPRQPQEIETAMARLLSDEPLAMQLGEAGRRTVKMRFSIDRVLPANEAFYRHCMAGHATDTRPRLRPARRMVQTAASVRTHDRG